MFASFASANAEVRLCLWAVVEAEHADDDALEISGNRNRAGTAAEGSSERMIVLFERDAEGRAHLGDGPGQPDASPRFAGFHDSQVVGMGECHDLGDVFRRCTMIGRELFAGQISALMSRAIAHRL